MSRHWVTDNLNAESPAGLRERLRLYRDMVDAIAKNDGVGDDERLQLMHVASMVSVVLTASVFAKTPEQVGRAVIRLRRSAV